MLAKLLQIGVALGLTVAGLETAGVGVVASIQHPIDLGAEWMTMAQIGRGLSVDAQLFGRVPHQGDLDGWLKVNMTTPGRDGTRDVWGTPYRLETERWNGLVLPADGQHFALCSAGPNRTHGDADDLHWTSFSDENNTRAFDGVSTVGRDVIQTVAGWVESARSTGGEALTSIGDNLGLTEKPRR